MATITWINSTFGNWNDKADWSGGVLPSALSDAVIDGLNGAIVVVSVTSDDITGNLITSNAQIDVNVGGVLEVTAAITANTAGVGFVQSGGTLLIDNGATYAGISNITGNDDAFIQSGGSIIISYGQLALYSNSNFAGTITDFGTLDNSRGGTIDFLAANGATGANYTLQKGFAISTTAWTIADAGTNIVLKENLSYAGTFDDNYQTTMQLSGNTLTLTGGGTISSDIGAAYIGNGKLLIAAGANVWVVNGGSNNAGASFAGGVTLEVKGILSEGGSNSLGATVTLGNQNTVESVMLIDANGVFNFANDDSVGGSPTNINLNTSGNALITVNGILEKTGGSGYSQIEPDLVLNASGEVVITSGEIAFGNPNINGGADDDFFGDIDGGTIENKGTTTELTGTGVVFGNGAFTLEAGSVIKTNQFSLGLLVSDHTTLDMKESLTYAGRFQANLDVSSIVVLNGHTLTLSGTADALVDFTSNLTGPLPGSLVLITGSYTDINAGSQGQGTVVDGSVTVAALGTIDCGPDSDNNSTTFALGGGSGTAVLDIGTVDVIGGVTKTVAGVFDFTGDSGNGNTGITNYGGIGNGIVYLYGTLEKTFGNGTDFVDPYVNMAAGATVGVASGNIEFFGSGGIFRGGFTNIQGTGGGITFGGGGTDTLDGGVSLRTNALSVFGTLTTLALGPNLIKHTLSYSGTLTEGAGTTLALNGNTLVLGGQVTSTANYQGPGEVLLASGATFTNTAGTNDAGISIGAGVIFDVARGTSFVEGVDNVQTTLTLGGSKTQSAELLIAGGGQFEFSDTNANSTINYAGGLASVQLNGTLERAAAGTGTNFVEASVTMATTGVVSVGFGNVEFTGVINLFAGKFISQPGGDGTVIFGGGGISTLVKGATISTFGLSIQDTGTTVQLAENLNYGGTLTEDTTTTLLLGGFGLTLTGSATLASLVGGSGSLSVGKAASVLVDSLTLGGSVVMGVAGNAALNGEMSIGDNGNSTAKLQIAATGTLNLGGTAVVNALGKGSLVNLGNIEKLTGNGAANIGAVVSNAGTITVDDGGLGLGYNATNTGLIEAAFDSTISFGNALIGSNGTTELSEGSTAVFGGPVSAGQTLLFDDANDNVAVIDKPALFAGTIMHFVAGDLIDLVNFSASSATLTGTTLALVGAGTTVDLTLAKAPTGGKFTLTSNGSGGTDLGYLGGSAAHHPDSASALQLFVPGHY